MRSPAKPPESRIEALPHRTNGLSKPQATWLLMVFAPLVALGHWLPALVDGRTPFLRDLLFFAVPTKAYWAERIRDGDFPFWTPYLGNGMPFLADPSNQTFYPLNVVFLAPWISPFAGVTIFVLLHVGLAVPSFTWLALRLGTTAPIACFAGIVYALSGYVLSVTDSINYLPGVVFVPLALAAMIPPSRVPGPREIGIGALAIACLIFGGNPLDAVFALAGASLVHLIRPSRAPRWFFACLGTIGLGTLLAAIQIFPTRELLALSVRASGLTFDDATALSLPPFRLLELVQPYIGGAPDYGEDIASTRLYPRHQTPWANSIYLGLIPGLLAIAAILLAPRRAAAWAILALVSAGLALGSHTPAFGFLREALPPLASFRYPEKLVLWTTISLLALAVVGLEEGRRSQWTRRKLVLGIGVTALLFLGSTGVSTSFENLASEHSAYWSSRFGIPLSATSGMWLHTCTLIALGAVGLLVMRRTRGWPLLLLGLAAVDLAFVHHGSPPLSKADWQSISDDAKRRLEDITKRNALEAIPRIYYDRGVPDDFLHHLAQEHLPNSTLEPEGAKVWEQLTVMRLRRLRPLLVSPAARYLNGRWSPLQLAQHHILETQDLQRAPHLTLRLSNVSLVVTPIEPRNPQWRGPGFTEAQRSSIDNLRILAVQGRLPRAYWVPGNAPPTTPVTWDISTPERLIVRAVNNTSDPKKLTLAETRYPGWRATIDERPARLERSQFLSVSVPPGKHVVQFSYHPTAAFWWGVTASVLSFLVIVSLLARPASRTPV